MNNWNPDDAVARMLERIKERAATNLRNFGYIGDWESLDFREIDAYLQENKITVPYPESANLAVLEIASAFERGWQKEPDRARLVLDAANLFGLAADANIDLVSAQRAGGRKSGAKRRAAKEKEWANINKAVIELKESHPHISSFSRLAELVAAKLGCSDTTVKRRAENPYKL